MLKIEARAKVNPIDDKPIKLNFIDTCQQQDSVSSLSFNSIGVAAPFAVGYSNNGNIPSSYSYFN